MEKLNPDKENLKKFGISMGLVLLAITVLFTIRHKSTIYFIPVIALIFLGLGHFASAILRPVYIVWMKLAFILGWINTRLILIILFYAIFTPMGLVMRLLRIDPLDRKIDKEADTYWRRKEKRKFLASDYDRQF